MVGPLGSGKGRERWYGALRSGRTDRVYLFSVCQLFWKTAKMNELQQALMDVVSQGEARPLLLKGSVEFRLKTSCVFGLGQM